MMLKTIVYSLLLIVIPIKTQAFEAEIQAPYAILINADSGAILFEKDADYRAPPASTIKIATALYALHVKGDRLEEMVTADANSLKTIQPAKKRKGNFSMPSHWLELDAITHGIERGERMSFNDLLHCHLLRSAADASNIIAKYVSGSISQFVKEINIFLREEIGLRDTQMTNPHGLHHPDQYTTPREMAKLTQAALRNPTFAQIVAKSSYLVSETNKSPARTIKQGNRLLRKGSFFYPKAIGVKTGYHSDAKYTLSAAASHEGRTLIAVVFRETHADRFRDVTHLFEKAFKEKKLRRRVLQKGPQTIGRRLPNADRMLQTMVPEDVYVEYYLSEVCDLKASLKWLPYQLPIQAGSQVATLELRREDNAYLVQEIPLYAQMEISHSLAYSIEQWARSEPLYFGFSVFLISLLATFLLRFLRIH